MTIPAGADSVECLIPVTDDEEPETPEDFTVTVALIAGTAPTNAALGTTVVTTVTIQDNGGQSARHQYLLWNELTIRLGSGQVKKRSTN